MTPYDWRFLAGIVVFMGFALHLAGVGLAVYTLIAYKSRQWQKVAVALLLAGLVLFVGGYVGVYFATEAIRAGWTPR